MVELYLHSPIRLLGISTGTGSFRHDVCFIKRLLLLING
jgi:hypothetical protein